MVADFVAEKRGDEQFEEGRIDASNEMVYDPILHRDAERRLVLKQGERKMNLRSFSILTIM